MKIEVDGVELLVLTETQKKVFQYELHKETCDQELIAMVKHIVEHKFNRCFGRMKKEWEEKFTKEGAASVPANKEKFADLVFKHKDYKDRTSKDLETKRLREERRKKANEAKKNKE